MPRNSGNTIAVTAKKCFVPGSNRSTIPSPGCWAMPRLPCRLSSVIVTWLSRAHWRQTFRKRQCI